MFLKSVGICSNNILLYCLHINLQKKTHLFMIQYWNCFESYYNRGVLIIKSQIIKRNAIVKAVNLIETILFT